VTASEGYASLAEVRYQIRRFLHFSEGLAREHGLEPQQHQALLVINSLPPHRKPTIREIASRLFIEHNSAIGLISRLERLGAVKRFKSEEDRREVLIRLTATGEHLLASLSETHEQELQVRAPELIRALQRVLRSSNGVRSA
jgi:DNA-binding MarR family transcriptional regulator